MSAELTLEHIPKEFQNEIRDFHVEHQRTAKNS